MKNKSLGFWLGLIALVGGTFVLLMSSGISQMPPSKMNRQELSRPNPLRADHPVPISGAIQQTALQSEEAQFPTVPAAPTAPLVAIPVPTASEPDNDPFFAPIVPAQPAPALPIAEPSTDPLPPSTTPPTAHPTAPSFEFLDVSPHELQTPSPLPSPLANADPFAAQQPEATVPVHALPEAQLPVQPPTQPLEPLRTASITPMAPAASQSRDEGTGLPGASALEGLQSPHLTLQKVLPEEVVIDQPATLKTVIQNVGTSVAKNVTITDRVPQGTRLISTIPEALTSPDGELRWSVGNLDPNVQLVIEMKVLPLREGEIGSVASVNYTGEASGRIVVTRPMLKVEVNAPAEVKLGETANVEIVISNPGTATVTNVIVEEFVPEGLFHRDGRVMRHDGITALKPKETRKLTLPLICTGSGNLVNHVVVTADGNLKVEDRTTIRALAPVLELDIVGARSRFLERRSDYRLVVANKGNASAHNVALELALPAAVQFVSTNQSGVYEASSHTVHWALEELPAQEAGEIELVVIPLHKGEHSLKFTGTGENNLRAESALPISIDGLPAITFEIVGDSNLVEIGKDVTYEIRVSNRGTKSAENLRVRVALAEGMSFVKAEGGRYQAAQGGTIQFETLQQLSAKGEHVYKLTARCLADGDHRINVQVISDDLRSPITKEESTRVFK